MKFKLFLFLCLVSFNGLAQDISGKVVCSETNDPLEYVSIGIVDEPIGTITNERGFFKLDINGIKSDKTIRFSMVGYKPKAFKIQDLSFNNNLIKLEKISFDIDELVFTGTRGKKLKVGTSSLTRLGGVCGWGGNRFGSGYELGTKISFGENPVKVESLHVRLYKQSYDSTFLRLHIRDIVDNKPGNELLREIIIFSLSKESGWEEVDLSKYNIVMKGDAALTLEWINVYGENVDKLIRVNKSKEPTANILFNLRKKKGLTLYIRKGSEAKWEVESDQSPSFYLTVID